MRNRKTLAAFLLAVWPVISIAGWTDSQGKPIPDTENMKSAGAFGVQLVLTADASAFVTAWKTAAISPNLKTTSSVRRGSTVSAMLILSGCKPNSNQKCDVSATYKIVGPDGTFNEVPRSPVWSGAAPRPGVVLLGEASVKIGIEKNEPLGRYRIIATVRDNNSGNTLSVSASLAAVE